MYAGGICMNEQMNEEQFLASELEVQLRKEDTLSLIPVSLLLSIIKDDNYYLAFTTNFDESRHLFKSDKQAIYAKAMKELIDAINKNNYDFQLTQTHQERIKYIIDNYTKEEKNYLKDIVECNNNYKFILSSKRSISLKYLYDTLSKNDNLNLLFNGIDLGCDSLDDYTNKEILEGFSLMLEQLDKQFAALNLDDDDPNLYKLISIVHTYSYLLDKEENRLYINKDAFKVMQKHLDNGYLSLILSSKAVPLEIKRQYIENINPDEIKHLSKNMELGELAKLSKEIEELKIDKETQRRIALATDYVSNHLINALKKVFNGFVPDEKYQELTKISTFFKHSGYSVRYKKSGPALGLSTGLNLVINLDMLYGEDDNPDAMLIDSLTHEAIHHLSTSEKFTGFKKNDEYFGINEAVTQYLTEQALGENAYVKIMKKSYCYYYRSVHFIERLVNMGVLSLPDLAKNYVENNVDYLQKSLMEYIDLDTYNHMITNFNILNHYGKEEDRNEAEQKLDALLIEIREKSKAAKKERKWKR